MLLMQSVDHGFKFLASLVGQRKILRIADVHWRHACINDRRAEVPVFVRFLRGLPGPGILVAATVFIGSFGLLEDHVVDHHVIR